MKKFINNPLKLSKGIHHFCNGLELKSDGCIVLRPHGLPPTDNLIVEEILRNRHPPLLMTSNRMKCPSQSKEPSLPIQQILRTSKTRWMHIYYLLEPLTSLIMIGWKLIMMHNLSQVCHLSFHVLKDGGNSNIGVITHRLILIGLNDPQNPYG